MRVLVLLLGALLLGCQATQPPAAPEPIQPRAPDPESRMLSDWLREVDSAMDLSAREARARLTAHRDEGSTAAGRFRLAVLYQRIGDWDSWVLARDIMRELRSDESLPPDVRRLTALLEDFSQVHINALQLRIDMGKALDEQTRLNATLQGEVRILEDKIRSLTSLEDSMNQRREEQSGLP